MSYFRNGRKKKKKSDIGRSGSGKICAILHVHYMHEGQRAFPKKRKTKVVSQSKNKNKKIAARSSLLH